jgi:hypothetical protein
MRGEVVKLLRLSDEYTLVLAKLWLLWGLSLLVIATQGARGSDCGKAVLPRHGLSGDLFSSSEVRQAVGTDRYECMN